MACISNDDFVDSMLCAIGEVIMEYSPDSIYLDGPIWYTVNCQCASCRRKYREKYGEYHQKHIDWLTPGIEYQGEQYQHPVSYFAVLVWIPFQ